MSANFAQTVLSASLAIGGTSLTVSTPSAPFTVPAAGAGRITLIDSAFAPTVMEIIAYTGRTNNGNGTFTYTGLTRGAEGTAAAAWSAGTVALQALTAGQYAADLGGKQATLVSGTNIKTINGQPVLGAGDLVIESGAGLTLLAESRSVASPNATVPVHALTVLGAETNIDFVIGVKGTGAILAQVPDGTAAGGNKRGANAIDLQTSRGSSSQVASGTGSVTIGRNNTASLNSVALGYANTTSSNSVALGNSNTANSTNAVALGTSNTATGAGTYAVALGYANMVSSAYAVALGSSNTANGESSFATGFRVLTRGIIGAVGEGYSASSGRQQMERFPLRRDTTDATTQQLTTNGSAVLSTTNSAVMPNNSAYYCRLRVLARNLNTGESMSWSGTALIKRGVNAAATTLVGSSLASDFGDAAMSACTVTLSADTTLGALAVTVTGLASTTISWVAQLETVEAA